MNNKSHLRKIFVLAVLVIGGGFAAYSYAAPTLSQQSLQTQQRRSGTIAYAQLTIQGQDKVTWDEGGTSIPRVDTLAGTTNRLGGSPRASVVNLLNAIGNNGWELVEITSNVYTFQR
jgi:hypothetical protein